LRQADLVRKKQRILVAYSLQGPQTVDRGFVGQLDHEGEHPAAPEGHHHSLTQPDLLGQLIRYRVVVEARRRTGPQVGRDSGE
jgi:hypothetical protein